MAARFFAGSRYWASLLSVTALAACTATRTASKCEHHEPGTATCQDLMMWLQRHGADISGLDFRSSENTGTGVFATDSFYRTKYGMFWRTISRLGLPFGNMTLASFPAKLVINQDSIMDDIRIGSILKAHVSSGALDCVEALQVWLLVQRQLGSQSEYAPYIAHLPKPDVPVVYSEKMLRELSGTEVHAAVQDLRLNLQKTWQNVQPVLSEAGIACEADFSSLSIDDWTWAFTILTSRSFNIPQSQKGTTTTVMSLVPGLDFLNHRKGSRVRWSPSVEKDTDTGCINLQCPAHDTPKNGDEVCIEYSQDASNFTLFFQYGFVEEMNEYDYVRIRYPCDASELQSELMNSRLALLQARTLPLDFVLPIGGAMMKNPLPKAGHDILEVFTMSQKAINRATAAPCVTQPLTLGDELAIYTTFCWLLEQHLQSLEGPDGTCSLSQDIEIIQRGPDGLSNAYWNSVVYRANQKHAVRKYANAAKEKVQEIIADMHSSDV